MAVLIEGISVVLRVDAIKAVCGDDWGRFVADAPNSTLCADGELVRVGFMAPEAVRDFVLRLERRGMRYLENGAARDMVVVDQQRGPMVACDWVEFAHSNLDGDAGKRVAACQRKGSTLAQVACPDGWTFEELLSASFGFIPKGKLHHSLEFHRREKGITVYPNRLTGEEAFIADVSDKAT